jgi:hypothetical protein
MANPIKGEVPLEINGQRYIFVLGTYGLASLERRMKTSFVKVFERAQRGEWGIDDVLAVLHAGLLRHHPRMTEQEVADLIDTAGMEYISEMIAEGLKAMQPVSNGGQGAENPPKEPIGNGSGTLSLPTG